jgi:succinate dehydrogenase/fumarate reductase flavoprotein subunit
MTEKVIDTDVLVVGSEGSGSRAAIEASKRNVRVTVVTKGRLAKSGVTMLAGADLALDGKSLHDMGFPGNPLDSKERFFRDIVVQGFYMNNQKLVESYVRDAPARVKELIDWGMNVYGSEERAVLASGVEIVKALQREIKRHNIEIVEDTMVEDLLVTDGKVVGAVGIGINTGEFVLFRSKAVVLATGGWHKAYAVTTGTEGLTGDGQGMAYRAGAELLNMEMVTFCPYIILWPPILRGSTFLYLLACHMVCGDLLNSREEPFLSQYNQKIVELGTKTEWNKLILSQFCMREVHKGKGTPHGGVYYSLRGIPWDSIRGTIERSYLTTLVAPGWKFQGTDFSEMMKRLMEGHLVEVGSVAHYFEGGIRINENCETSLAGLYAAGECSGGLFGANRVAAATTEMLVEGAIAGRFAAMYAGEVTTPEIDMKQIESFRNKVLQPLKREDGIKPIELRKRIQQIAHEIIGVIRDGVSLKRAIEELERTKREELPRLYTTAKFREYNREWIEALELENIVQVLEMSAKSALTRTESRGVHYRIDYPNLDNEHWLKEIVIKQVAGEMQVATHPITITTMTPPGGIMTFEDSILKAIEGLET